VRLPFIRVVQPRGTVVSLGRSQRHIAVDALPARYRTSGGGAVLAGPWLLKALVVLPRPHGWLDQGPARAAQRFADVHRRWLAAQGIETETYRGPVLDHWACFAGRSPGELLVHDRKITGIAQTWRRRRVLLWSGTLLGGVPWDVLANALSHAPEAERELSTAAVSAQELLFKAPDALGWGQALAAALQGALDPNERATLRS